MLADAPTEDRFIKYLPAYTPEKAYKHFIKKQKTAKPDGWLEVPLIPGNYSDSQFVVQVKGNALLPLYDADSWIILNHSMDYSNATNNICLVYHKSISDNYEGNFALRKLGVSSYVPSGSFLPVTEILLQSLSEKQSDISIKGIIELSDISIVGINNYSPAAIPENKYNGYKTELDIAAENDSTYKKNSK